MASNGHFCAARRARPVTPPQARSGARPGPAAAGGAPSRRCRTRCTAPRRSRPSWSWARPLHTVCLPRAPERQQRVPGLPAPRVAHAGLRPPVLTTGQDFLHSCRHFFGLHLRGRAAAQRQSWRHACSAEQDGVCEAGRGALVAAHDSDSSQYFLRLVALLLGRHAAPRRPPRHPARPPGGWPLTYVAERAPDGRVQARCAKCSLPFASVRIAGEEQGHCTIECCEPLRAGRTGLTFGCTPGLTQRCSAGPGPIRAKFKGSKLNMVNAAGTTLPCLAHACYTWCSILAWGIWGTYT